MPGGRACFPLMVEEIFFFHPNVSRFSFFTFSSSFFIYWILLIGSTTCLNSNSLGSHPAHKSIYDWAFICGSICIFSPTFLFGKISNIDKSWRVQWTPCTRTSREVFWAAVWSCSPYVLFSLTRVPRRPLVFLQLGGWKQKTLALSSQIR